jgi:Flp pilus assembly protein TadD
VLYTTIALLLLIFSTATSAEIAGTLVHATGALHLGGKTIQLKDKTSFQTQSNERASILLTDETLLRIDHNSKLTIDREGPQTQLQLDYGRIWVLNKKIAANLAIKTPTAIIGIRGTELSITYDEKNKTAVTALEGNAWVSNPLGALTLQAGEIASIDADSPPSKTITLTPENSVQWTVVIPKLISPELLTYSTHPEKATQIWSQLQQRELSSAQQIAQTAIERYPEDGVLHLLHALSSLLTGDTDQALHTSLRATTLLPSSAESWIIHAYILQSIFQLQQAEDASNTALTLSPGHPIASQQLARLQFGSGRTKEAKATLDKIQIESEKNTTHQAQINTLKGFIALSLRQLDQAHLHFKQAIQQDDSQAEPHLGLGLIAARRGESSKAKTEITTAILLNPRRALLRSYWAKILYQLGRHQKALDVLHIAQNIDPRDPTPHLYRALILHDLNRPSEAIQALHKAVALNNQKAVYRSRLLLDKDLAVKNISLASLYSQLGLNGWARTRALAAIQEDISNPSAHLFLANTLDQEGTRAWASQTEHLLARLMQPANNNTFNSYNHYTTFLEQPSRDSTLTLRTGNQQSHEEKLIISGYQPEHHFAWQAGLLHSTTDGWRNTNGSKAKALATYLKWEAQPNLNVMGVISLSNNNQTDAFYPRYEYDAPAIPDEKIDSKVHRLEIGLHQQPHPDTQLLLHGACFKNQFNGLSGINNYIFQQQQPFCQLQGRWIHKQSTHQLSAGAIHMQGDDKNNWVIESLQLSNQPQTKRHASTLFLRDHWQLNPELSIEADLHFESMQNSNSDLTGAEWKLHKINPGVGFSYRLDNQQTVRMAAFQALTPFLSDRLDPATLAGIPIHRNGPPGTTTKEWDIVWEKEWLWGYATANLFRATRYSELHYSEDATNPNHHNLYNGKLQGIQLEGGRLLKNNTGLTTRYLYQRTKDASLNGKADREEHHLELGLRWQNPAGYFGGIKEQYRKINSVSPNRPDEEIFITHLNLGYAFRNKKGNITLETTNLFDRHFNWVTDRFDFSGEPPGRSLQLKLTLNY